MPGLEELLTGRTLVKRYRIEEVIGRGGFAAVYRAADERLGRDVAVKVITYPAPDADTLEQLRARFQREARAAASLPQHPNAVTVHDFGTDPELGLDFLVMELLDGDDLATYLAGHDCPPLDSALSILRAATEGIAVGHRVGLIHRDVKPANIFLARSHEGEPYRVCVLDFGIARVVADENLTQLTKGATPHSPAYGSPEQLRGEPELTPASDVFSLGVVGYQLLSGVKPFDEDRRGGSPEGSIPTRPLREVNPKVPAALASVVERAMAVDPAARYASAEEVARALDEAAPVVAPLPPTPLADDATLLHPEPTPPARPPSVAGSMTAPPPPPRGRGAGMWVAIVLLALLAAGGVIWASSRGADDETAAEEETAGEPPVVAVPESGPVVTGEIVETGEPSGSIEPDGTVPPPTGSGVIVPAGPTTTSMPPARLPPGATRPTDRPSDTRPNTPTPRPTLPPANQPARPARPDSAAPDTTRPPPRLLGDPIRRDSTRRDTTTAG